MVHRQTGAASSFRAYDGGGARALIDKIDDSPLMQAMTGQGMKGESFSASKSGKSKGPEAPQNYGFTSVVAAATKGANGMIKQCAEGFMSFMGGNRSFPVASMMDDRRHRLKNLIKDAAEGSVAMHGLKEWGQQFMMTDNGMFMTGNAGKTQGKSGGGGGGAKAATAAAGGGGSGEGENFKIRFQLVENQNGKKQQQSSSAGARALPRSFHTESGTEFEIETFVLDEEESRIYDAEIARGRSVAEAEVVVEAFARERDATARAANGGGDGGGDGGGGNQAGNSKPTGQKSLHKEKSETFHEITAEQQHMKRGEGNVKVKDKVVLTHWKDDKKSTRCDDKHVHIRFDGNQVWADKDGCWSSKPIQIRSCDDQSARAARALATGDDITEEIPGPILSGPPAYYADAPLSINNEGELDLAYKAPLIVDEADDTFTLAYKAPLFVDTDGALTSASGGGAPVNAEYITSTANATLTAERVLTNSATVTWDRSTPGQIKATAASSGGGIAEAPADTLSYGRKDNAWTRVLAITGDVLDGGNF